MVSGWAHISIKDSNLLIELDLPSSFPVQISHIIDGGEFFTRILTVSEL